MFDSDLYVVTIFLHKIFKLKKNWRANNLMKIMK